MPSDVAIWAVGRRSAGREHERSERCCRRGVPHFGCHYSVVYAPDIFDEDPDVLPLFSLTDDGLIFLWVTGRAMELGRECLKLWGYERCDELIWVKTNQLQRIIRTGRTGHWLNHGKEHCLVGVKGNPKVGGGSIGTGDVARPTKRWPRFGDLKLWQRSGKY